MAWNLRETGQEGARHLGQTFSSSLLTFFLICLRLSFSVLLSEESAGGVSHCDDPIFSLVATVDPQKALDLPPLRGS